MTYKEDKRKSDSYRSDNEKKSINHEKSGKDRKLSTAKLAKFDKQCY